MRQVRFVALSEDGQAMVLADEVGHLLSLPIDERISALLREGRPAPLSVEEISQLSPRDIQARIRAGESAQDVARIAGVPVDRVLRFAGPVLQERAMLAQQARRTKLRSSHRGATLAEVVDARLSQLGVDAEAIVWDAHRREDGTWRVVASWPSGRAHAAAVWEMDRARQSITSHDDMAQYLCASPSESTARGGHEVATQRPDPAVSLPALGGRESRSTRDPISGGRDALLAALERPLDAAEPSDEDSADDDAGAETPVVPSLAVLRPRRGAPEVTERPSRRRPQWDDVLFGPAKTP
jgi:hypothetical protein